MRSLAILGLLRSLSFINDKVSVKARVNLENKECLSLGLFYQHFKTMKGVNIFSKSKIDSVTFSSEEQRKDILLIFLISKQRLWHLCPQSINNRMFFVEIDPICLLGCFINILIETKLRSKNI